MKNTNQMVSVPSELLEQALDAAAAVGMQDVADELDCILTPSTAQHQGEPAALPARMPAGNITEPHHPWAPGVREGWNKCLDEIAKRGPLYPHADPGEVERLQAEIRSLRQHKTDYMEAAEEMRKALLAQQAGAAHLAERLRQSCLGLRRQALAELLAYLSGESASAEPSAPVERDERAAFELVIGQKWPGIRMLRINRPGAPADGEYELPGLEAAWQGWQARAALERLPAPETSHD